MSLEGHLLFYNFYSLEQQGQRGPSGLSMPGLQQL
jgi:hypothetical protein